MGLNVLSAIQGMSTIWDVRYWEFSLYNKPGDLKKEFWEKAIQFHGTFHGLKITD